LASGDTDEYTTIYREGHPSIGGGEKGNKVKDCSLADAVWWSCGSDGICRRTRVHRTVGTRLTPVGAATIPIPVNIRVDVDIFR
jgi:hypothetical protein